MESFARIFQHRPANKVIICQKHRYAVPPSQVKTHIEKHHDWESKSIRESVVLYVADLQPLAWEHNDVVYPEAGLEPIPNIPIYKNGLECGNAARAGCGFVCETRNAMIKHCKSQHNWVSRKGRGGSKRTKEQEDPNQMWTEGIRLQRLFEYAQWKKGFKVKEEQGIVEGEGLAREAEAMLERIEKDKKRAQENRVVTVSTSRVEMNSWMEHTKWASHLEGFEVEKLRNSLQPVEGGLSGETDTEGEAALQRACKQASQVIGIAFRKCNTQDIPRSALHAINRRENGATTNETPFYNKHKANTLKKYCVVVNKIIRYIWRSQQWEKKPEYRLNARQREALQELQDAAHVSSRGMDRKAREDRKERIRMGFVRFWLSLIEHVLRDVEWESGLLSGLAVLGLDTETGGWCQALNYTPHLSAIITVTRALVVYYAWHQKNKQMQQYIGEGSSKEEAEDRAKSIVEIVKSIAKGFMTLQEYDGEPTPIDRIMHMRTYGMNIRYNTKGTARVRWSDSGEVVSIDKTRFSMDELRMLIKGLVTSCREKLAKLLFIEHEDQLPEIPMQKLRDNQGNTEPGWSFCQEKENKEVFEKAGLGGEGRKWLWSRLTREKDAAMQHLFLEPSARNVNSWEDIKWKQHGILEYFAQVKVFKEELIVLYHLSAGGPGRGPEVMSIPFKNAPDGTVHRGFFVHDGMVESVSDYHKGASSSGTSKIVHRFVAKEVGEVIVMYLWAVEPFVDILQTVYGRETGEEDFIASGYQMWAIQPEPEFRGVGDEGEESESESGSEKESGSGSGGESGSEEEEQRSEHRSSEKSGGSENEGRVERRRAKPASKKPAKEEECPNVDGWWDTDRLGRIMKREWRSRGGIGFSTSQWRQLFPAILRMYSPDPEVHTLLDDVYLNKKQTMVHEQSGHTKFMEENMYGLRTDENPFSTHGNQARFKKASKHWHQFLEFPSAIQGRVIDQEKEREGAARREKKWKEFQKMNLFIRLREMVGEGARFRGKQREGLRAIMGGEAQVVVVMGTGSGKSLLYQLPAMCSPQGLTIVVVPMTALQDDQAKRCRKAGLEEHVWVGEGRPGLGTAQVVIVIPESAVTKAFGRFIEDQYHNGRLERIVIDECHVVLDSVNGWREKMFELKEMASKGCQMVWMTATLPPKNEIEWMAAMGVNEEEAVWIREPTTRKNIEYRVKEYLKEEENEEVKQLVEEKLRQYRDGVIIVYGNIQQCKDLAEVLQCPKYYREVGSRKEKKRLLEELVQGRIRVITATNALGLGIDMPNIRVVINVGVRRKMRDFAQESGRAGRDGEKCESIVMRSYGQEGGRRRLERGWGTEEAMLEFVEGKKCKRIVLDKEMDGRVDRYGCEIGDERCDVCQGQGNRRVRVVVGNQRPARPARPAEPAEQERVQQARQEADEEWEDDVERTEEEMGRVRVGVDWGEDNGVGVSSREA